MTDQNQLLREALQDIEQAHDLSLDLDHYASRQVLVSLADKIKAALAQPAEGGGAVAWTERELELIDGMIQVQLDHAARCDGIANRGMADRQKLWDMERVALLKKVRCTTPPASQDQAQQPSTQAWANETGLRQIECPSCGDLAVAYDPQQPSPATPADMAVYQSIADGYTKAQQPSDDDWPVPEGWATSAEAQTPSTAAQGSDSIHLSDEGAQAIADSVADMLKGDADEHQPSGEVAERARKQARSAQAAVKTLERLGYTYHGAELWKPPIGTVPASLEPFSRHLDATPKPEPIVDEALWEMWVDSPSDVLAFARRIEAHHGITAQGAQEGV